MVLMGVSGAGKSTLGAALAKRLGCPMIDCDDLHSPANIEKMSRGTPLDDADRAPWLAVIAARLAELSRSGTTAVIACSALKKVYRSKLFAGCDEVLLIYLKADRDEIERRMQERRGHFMPVGLLDSQFAALEEPASDERTLELDVRTPLEENLRLISIALRDRRKL